MNKALEYALKLLAKKDYTEAELRQKFQFREVNEEEAEAALLFLKQKKFIDDMRYAIMYRKVHRSRGDIRIKYELIKRGVDSQIITDLLSERNQQDQVESAKEIAEAWIKKKEAKYPDKYKLKANIIAKLSRQGFSYDIICQALEGLMD